MPLPDVLGGFSVILIFSRDRHINVFKASALWTDAFYKSKCPSVCLSVCLSVCVFTFEVPFKRLSAPLPEVGCPIFLEIRNPWGKVV